MLYKILMVIASVVGMLASSFLPAAEVLGDRSEPGSPAPGLVPLQRLATLSSEGKPGAAVSILWAEVDGRRVDEDTRAQGYLKELKFKVGLRPAPGRSLQIGESVLDLAATDVITVREFTGRVTLEGVTGPAALLSLDGEVQATFVNEAHVKKVATEGRTAVPKTLANLAYLTLDIGQVNTVELKPGGDVVQTADTREGLAPIPVAWLRVDDRVLSEYTWAEGFVESIEFLAKPMADRTMVFGSAKRAADDEIRYRVEKFVGTYVLFLGENGQLLLKLDGYAEKVDVLPGRALGVAGLSPKPTARFEFEPQAPTTSDSVVFVDRSVAPPGATILLREWNFGDGTISTAQAPKHRFKDPGRTYYVTLIVTDSNLERSEPYVAEVVPLNSRPVAEFDFYPKLPTDLEAVQFSDRSWDVDGAIASFQWDFGDGRTSTERTPSHRFADNGVYTVRLTVRDGHGATNSIAKVVSVANVPPTPSFSYLPVDPTALDLIEFRDTSTDEDGTIVSSSWSFGDGSPSETGSVVRHRFPVVGEYPVTLTTRDNDGATAQHTTVIRVRNLPPAASFAITTPAENRTTGQPICFRDTSTDEEGPIASRSWRFGTGPTPGTSSLAEPCFRFPERGVAVVNLTVKDARGATGWVESTFVVANGAPVANFFWTPAGPVTRQEILFTSSSTDPDGDSDLRTFEWSFPGGATATGRSASRSFLDDGVYTVRLTVTDSAGHVSTVDLPVAVANRAPRAWFTATNANPIAGEVVTFRASPEDPDGFVREVVWTFDGGYTLRGDPLTGNHSAPTYAFAAPGLRRVSLYVIDDDGEQSPTYTVTMQVLPPPPIANFTWSPNPAIAQETVTFQSTSYGIGTSVVSWSWTFGDGGQAAVANPQYIFGGWGTVPVTLTVKDDNRPPRSTSITKNVPVNARPTANFGTSLPVLHAPVAFTDSSSDPDGTIANWTWDFGDGSPVSHSRNPTHTYDRAGTYNVRLTVVDDRGASASIASPLTLQNRAPVVTVTVDPAEPVANATATLRANASDPEGAAVTVAWGVFGPDGKLAASGNGTTMSYVFPMTGVYTVRATAVDADGATSIASRSVRVLSDAPKTITFGVTYPDRTPIDLATAGLTGTLGLRHAITKAAIPVTGTVTTATPGIATVTIPAGGWAAGDSLPVTFRRISNGGSVNPQDLTKQPTFLLATGASQPSPASFPLRMTWELSMTLRPPESRTTVHSEPYDPAIEGCNPVCWSFPDQAEPVLLNLSAVWEGTNHSVNGAVFTVRTMWIGNRNFFPSGEPAPPIAGRETNVLTFVDTTTANTYRIPYFAPLPGTVAQPAGAVVPSYLPGWYRVQVSVGLEGHTPAPTPPKTVHFFEDPFGLLQPMGRPVVG